MKPSTGSAVYVHIPFCRRRCGYCNFSLVAGRDHLIPRYLDCLKAEIATHPRGETISTLFIGGGTPSHLSPAQLRQLFALIRSRFEFSEEIELTIECNPNDLSIELAATLHDCGVNRLSFGVQSFNPKKLQALERQHQFDDIRMAVERARPVTDNISFDLIFGVPHETVAEWEDDLQIALSFRPAHLSTYELTIEKGTSFWNRQQRNELTPLSEDTRAEMFELAIDKMSQAGYEHYEVSSFGLPGRACRHNLVYWSGRDYYAFGPGASRLVNGVRETNHFSAAMYIRRLESGQSPVAERQEIALQDQAVDALIFGLRKVNGIPLDEFRLLTGQSVTATLGSAAKLLINEGLIQLDRDRCRLTRRGIMVYDGVATAILSADRDPV